MKKSFSTLLLFIFLSISYSAIAGTHWKNLAPGIDYTSLANPAPHTFGYIHCFKINLQKNNLQLAFAKSGIFPAATVQWLAEGNHALLAVNGGFFTSTWNPIGLRIQNGHQHSSLQPTSWWPVFYLKNNKPHIVNEKNYHDDPQISFAVQGGPRLLRDGHIPNLKPGKAERTALGITVTGEVIILATEHWELSTEQLAHIIQEQLDGVQAMNLDGGSSTQMYANIGKFQLDIKSFALITDIVYVTPRSISGN